MKHRTPVVAALAALAALIAPAAASADHNAAPIHPGVQTLTQGGQCTSNFVFRDGGGTYLGQAAHCSGTGAATDTNGCDAGTLPLGTQVEITGATRPGTLAYSSWNAMQSAGETDENTCAYNDFALVRVDPADVASIDPTVPGLGGPTSVGRPRRHAGRHRLLVRQLVAPTRDPAAPAEAGHGDPERGRQLVPHGADGDAGHPRRLGQRLPQRQWAGDRDALDAPGPAASRARTAWAISRRSSTTRGRTASAGCSWFRAPARSGATCCRPSWATDAQGQRREHGGALRGAAGRYRPSCLPRISFMTSSVPPPIGPSRRSRSARSIPYSRM